jgi:hypothetical protein
MALFGSFTNASARAQGAIASGNIRATGGTISTYGRYRVHEFTSSGTFIITSGRGLIEYIVVAGGGAGGYGNIYGAGGGGGAGGLIEGSQLVGPGTYTITVGAGGSQTPNGSVPGNPSSLSGPGMTTVTSMGGGSGATYYDGTTTISANGASGGSGGGGLGGNSVSSHGNGTSGQGFRGGSTPGQGTFSFDIGPIGPFPGIPIK